MKFICWSHSVNFTFFLVVPETAVCISIVHSFWIISSALLKFCKFVELPLFWITSRIAIVDLTARDTVAKSFLSHWSINHKIFVANNISSRNVIWNTIKEINKFDQWLAHSEFEFFEIISSRARTISLYHSLTLLHACQCDNQQVTAALTRWQGCKSYACCNLEKIWRFSEL